MGNLFKLHPEFYLHLRCPQWHRGSVNSCVGGCPQQRMVSWPVSLAIFPETMVDHDVFFSREHPRVPVYVWRGHDPMRLSFECVRRRKLMITAVPIVPTGCCKPTGNSDGAIPSSGTNTPHLHWRRLYTLERSKNSCKICLDMRYKTSNICIYNHI